MPLRGDRTQQITVASQFDRTAEALMTYTIGTQA
jgi:hypothetical protein